MTNNIKAIELYPKNEAEAKSQLLAEADAIINLICVEFGSYISDKTPLTKDDVIKLIRGVAYKSMTEGLYLARKQIAYFPIYNPNLN